MKNNTQTPPSDAVLGFERAMTAAKKKSFDAHIISSARIIAGTWSESDLCPAMQEYVNQHRHLHTPKWIKPNDLALARAGAENSIEAENSQNGTKH